MNIKQNDNNKEIADKLAEAELYLQHGLEENAQSIYEDLLRRITEPSNPLRAQIQKRLNSLASGQQEQSPKQPTASIGTKNDAEQVLENCTGLIEAGFHTEAIGQLEGLIKTGFRSAAIYTQIAECYLFLDRPFDALESLEQAINNPQLTKREDRLDILDRLAVTYERTGSIPAAKKALEQIVHLDPEFRNSFKRLKNLSQSAQKFGRFFKLVNNNLLSSAQLDSAREQAKAQNKSIEIILLKNFNIEKDKLGESLGEYYGCPFVGFDQLEAGEAPSCIKGIKPHFFRNNNCVPISEEANSLVIAVDNPNDLAKIDDLRSVLKVGDIKFVVSLKEDIDQFINHFYGNKPDLPKQKQQQLGSDKDVFEELELVDEEAEIEMEDEGEDVAADSDGIVVQVTNKIIEDAYLRDASDIHIESLTGKRGALVRFRVDGECSEYRTIPFKYKRALVSRIKIISKLDIAERRLPQDGKIKFATRGGRKIELRVATLPTTGGNEDVVLRILAASDAMPLKAMGLLDRNLTTLQDLLQTPYGLVLVVGPTGSGKTTTLHAALGHINRPERKIWTVEDPVEIVQDGLRQVQVHNLINLTFARVLKAFLRADPDVIMVGETRDEETALTVIEASLTGHLVFSTLHTNSAPETVTRLLGMGIDPFNFADALLGVLAQRLVKRLCSKCREPYQPDEAEIQNLIKEYGEHPNTPLQIPPDVSLNRPKGCPACKGAGYKGRIAIHELLTTNDAMKMMIEQSKPVIDIRNAAMAGGMLTLKQDGINKVLQGHTDLQQVRKACIK